MYGAGGRYPDTIKSGEHRKRERPLNNGSRLLTDGENAIFFSLLGYDCFSLAAGIVQLLKSDPTKPRTWIQLCGGIVTLVKDYGRRAYYLRLYDITQREFKWQQMLYKNFQGFSTVCPNLLYFEGDECVYGLNFSSRDEAENFKTHLDRRYQQEQKTQQRKNQEARMRASGQRGAPAGYTVPTKTGITAAGTIPNVTGQLSLTPSSKKKKSKKEKKSKLKKADISNPTNFQHKAHIGWDANGGFSQETYDSELMDNSVRDLLKAAGENPDRMTKDEIDFTYRFLHQYQKAPAAQAAPPPPARRDRVQKPARPSRPLPQPPAGARPADIPPAPPKETVSVPAVTPVPAAAPVSANAPPPPPPPPAEVAAPVSGGATGGGRGDLLSQIRAGHSLKPVSEEPPTPKAATRDDVMAQIRQGTVLKPVDKAALEDKKPVALEDIGGIAGALAKALKEIREKVHDSEESSEEEEENNDDEWASD